MPERPFCREQAYLLPPSLDEWVAIDHPVRFVEAFVAQAMPATRAALGLSQPAEQIGAPRYAPALLARVWVYGFMTGVRSARALERACEEQVPVRWLTGNQTPDHTTLWRWYRAHQAGMRALLAESVQVAARAGLVDLALLAVDGTKLRANAAADRMLTADELEALRTRTEAAIAALEAQNAGDEGPPPPRLPHALRTAAALRDRITAAQAACAARAATRGKAASVGTPRGNVTDPAARWMKTRLGTVPAYNAQVAVVATTGRAQALLGAGVPAGRIVVAAAVTTQPTDTAQLGPLVAQAAEHLGVVPSVTVADAGYFDGAQLAAAAALGTRAVVPEPDRRASHGPYHRVQFRHDPATDTLRCPTQQTLRRLNPTAPPTGARRYGGLAPTCRVCPAFGACTRNAREGRVVTLTPHDATLQTHRDLRAWAPHRLALARRKTLVEGVIGTLKTVVGERQVRARGRAHVEAEWQASAVGLNLRTLHRCWGALPAPQRWQVLPHAA
jgi:transposase